MKNQKEKIKELIQENPVVVVSGGLGMGKRSLVEEVIKDIGASSYEINPSLFEEDGDLLKFAEKAGDVEYLIIDEVNRLYGDENLKFLKKLLHSGRKTILLRTTYRERSESLFGAIHTSLVQSLERDVTILLSRLPNLELKPYRNLNRK